MDDHIPHGVKKERVRMISDLGSAKLLDFSMDQIGTKSNVLFEKGRDGLFEGYTSNFVRVWVESSFDLTNQIKNVEIKEFKKEKLFGEISE